MNKYIKAILVTLTTIVLGAIGSGVWERILSPLLSFTTSALTGLLSGISSGYSDLIYKRASNIYITDSSDGVVVIYFIFTAALLYYAVNTRYENEYLLELQASAKRSFQGWRGIMLSGALFLSMFFIMSTEASVSKVRVYSLTQMEILRPHIGEHDYLLLKAEFLQVNSELKFKAFLNNLYGSAEKVGLKTEKIIY